MRASRPLTSCWIAVILVMAASRSSLPIAAAHGAGDALARLARTDAVFASEAFLAAAPVAPVAGAEEVGRPPLAAFRLERFARPPAPMRAQAARIAALSVSRLAFAHALDAARFGWFSFGSTAPPPFQG